MPVPPKKPAGFIGPSKLQSSKNSKKSKKILYSNIVIVLNLSARVIRQYYMNRPEATEIQREALRDVAKALQAVLDGFPFLTMPNAGGFFGWVPDSYSAAKVRLAQSFLECCSWADDLAGDRQKETYKQYLLNSISACQTVADLKMIDCSDIAVLDNSYHVLKMLGDYFVGLDKTDQVFVDFLEALNSNS